MDAAALVAALVPLPDALDALLARLPDADWRWRPADGGWSLLEVVNHLADEEVEDFRVRLRSTLEDPSAQWPAFDGGAAVTARRYQERSPAESLARFRRERAASLAWLRALRDPAWENVHRNPHGALAAGELLASWAAHDARHLSQVAKRLYGLAARDGAPHSVGYAG